MLTPVEIKNNQTTIIHLYTSKTSQSIINPNVIFSREAGRVTQTIFFSLRTLHPCVELEIIIFYGCINPDPEL